MGGAKVSAGASGIRITDAQLKIAHTEGYNYFEQIKDTNLYSATANFLLLRNTDGKWYKVGSTVIPLKKE